MAERYELKPIGNTAEYTPGANTSWYLEIDKIMYIFDCPYSNIDWLMGPGKKLVSSMTQIVIFITSLKESRIGGLKGFTDIIAESDIKYMVYVPLEIWMPASNYLELVGNNIGQVHLMRGDYYQDNNVQIFPREVDHDGLLRSFAYIVYGGDLFINDKGTNWSVYYSPDNRIFMDEATLGSFLTDPSEKTIYHGITYNIDDETHCYKDRVTKAVKKDMRSHIYPINIDDVKDVRKFKTLGFNIA